MRKLLLATALTATFLGASFGPAMADHGGGHADDPPGSHNDPVVNPGVACTHASERSGGVSSWAIGTHPGTGHGSQGYELCDVEDDDDDPDNDD
jgi:hypothetical protein